MFKKRASGISKLTSRWAQNKMTFIDSYCHFILLPLMSHPSIRHYELHIKVFAKGAAAYQYTFSYDHWSQAMSLTDWKVCVDIELAIVKCRLGCTQRTYWAWCVTVPPTWGYRTPLAALSKVGSENACKCMSMTQSEWRGIDGTAGLGYWTHEPDGSLPLAHTYREPVV